MTHPSRKSTQPFAAHGYQDWAAQQVSASHDEALYGHGELCLYTLMWRPVDHDRGLVDRCPTCFEGVKGRQAAAFKQPTRHECPDCFGTTFEGGYRAQIVRPTIWSDRNEEMNDEPRGVVTRETLQIETTGDFTMHKSDYVFRFDNTRYQAEEKREGILRTGFHPAWAAPSLAGNNTVHREETTAVAFRIPPLDPVVIEQVLGIPGPFRVLDITAGDDISPGGYLL